jgi:hypothetical protein
MESLQAGIDYHELPKLVKQLTETQQKYPDPGSRPESRQISVASTSTNCFSLKSDDPITLNGGISLVSFDNKTEQVLHIEVFFPLAIVKFQRYIVIRPGRIHRMHSVAIAVMARMVANLHPLGDDPGKHGLARRPRIFEISCTACNDADNDDYEYNYY